MHLPRKCWPRSKAERDIVIRQEFAAQPPYAGLLAEGPGAIATVQALRGSRWTRLLQRMGLLWQF